MRLTSCRKRINYCFYLKGLISGSLISLICLSLPLNSSAQVKSNSISEHQTKFTKILDKRLRRAIQRNYFSFHAQFGQIDGIYILNSRKFNCKKSNCPIIRAVNGSVITQDFSIKYFVDLFNHVQHAEIKIEWRNEQFTLVYEYGVLKK